MNGMLPLKDGLMVDIIEDDVAAVLSFTWGIVEIKRKKKKKGGRIEARYVTTTADSAPTTGNVQGPSPVYPEVQPQRQAFPQVEPNCPASPKVSTEQVPQQQAAVTIVQVSSGAEPTIAIGDEEQPTMLDDSTTAAATTVHKQPFDSIKKDEAVEVKKYESKKVSKGKTTASQVKAQKEVAQRATKMSGSMKFPFRSRQVNISQPYTTNEKGCKRWLFESKGPTE
nr:hypothetical protein Iba_chr02aCG10380 [Ipomoea batatas]